MHLKLLIEHRVSSKKYTFSSPKFPQHSKVALIFENPSLLLDAILAMTNSRLKALRAHMRAQKLDAWIVFTADPHLSEYVPDYWMTRAWLTGFHGSAGTAVVTNTDAALFTDSRYWLRAQLDLEGTGISLIKSGAPDAPSVSEWLATHLPSEAKIGLDPHFLSAQHLNRLIEAFENKGFSVIPTKDLISEIWQDRPARPCHPVIRLQASSRSVTEKLQALRAVMHQKDCINFVTNSLDEIAWFLNLRGTDVDYNPVFLANMVVMGNTIHLFTESSRFTSELIETLTQEGVQIEGSECFTTFLERLNGRTLLDPDRVNAVTFSLVTDIVEALSPLTLMKSQKTDAEIASIRLAMEQDGVAITQFQADLEARLARGEALTEIKVAQLLHERRAARPGFMGESFGTISAFGPNAALPHYTPSKDHDASITRGLLLIDSGGQYETGTTDITRMFAIGELTPEEKHTVTLVLKGHIKLAQAHSPLGVSGAQLDAYARAPLWQEGYDYGHGTGHGVGYILSVHEGPFRISPSSTSSGELGLQPGIVVSNEPGLYLEGRWGVRIENLLAARRSHNTEFGEFLNFEVLSLAPIDIKTLDLALLTAEEKAWLNNYHTVVRERLTPYLDPKTATWLANATLPV